MIDHGDWGFDWDRELIVCHLSIAEVRLGPIVILWTVSLENIENNKIHQKFTPKYCEMQKNQCRSVEYLTYSSQRKCIWKCYLEVLTFVLAEGYKVYFYWLILYRHITTDCFAFRGCECLSVVHITAENWWHQIGPSLYFIYLACNLYQQKWW